MEICSSKYDGRVPGWISNHQAWTIINHRHHGTSIIINVPLSWIFNRWSAASIIIDHYRSSSMMIDHQSSSKKNTSDHTSGVIVHQSSSIIIDHHQSYLTDHYISSPIWTIDLSESSSILDHQKSSSWSIIGHHHSSLSVMNHRSWLVMHRQRWSTIINYRSSIIIDHHQLMIIVKDHQSQVMTRHVSS